MEGGGSRLHFSQNKVGEQENPLGRSQRGGRRCGSGTKTRGVGGARPVRARRGGRASQAGRALDHSRGERWAGICPSRADASSLWPCGRERLQKQTGTRLSSSPPPSAPRLS